MRFVEICTLQDIPNGASRAARIGAVDIALFNTGGEVHAIENSCLHAGASLAGGRLCGKMVSCPVHGWRYDVTTGALGASPTMKLRTFAVRPDGEKVMVEVKA